MTRWAALVMATLVALAGAAGCGGEDPSGAPDDGDGLRVAAFDFVESELLAELYAQVLEDRGVPVVRLGRVGPREIVAPALEAGAVDLVPEYAGSALGFFGGATSSRDAAVVVTELNDLLDARGLRALTPARAVDSNVFVVATSIADALGLVTLSDLAGSGLDRFGGPAECPDRPLCLAGLRDMYGVTFSEFVAQPSLTFTAEALRRGEIDVGLLFSTSPELDDPGLVALEDDLGLQPLDNIVPMLRLEAIEGWDPAVVDGLDEMSTRLTTEELRGLNRRVADGVPVPEVATDWLRGRGLLE